MELAVPAPLVPIMWARVPGRHGVENGTRSLPLSATKTEEPLAEMATAIGSFNDALSPHSPRKATIGRAEALDPVVAGVGDVESTCRDLDSRWELELPWPAPRAAPVR